MTERTAVRIVDFHTHIDSVPSLGWDLAPESILAGMDAAGVDVSVVTSIMDAPVLAQDGLETLAGIVASSHGRLRAMARMHPWAPDAVRLFRYAVEKLGFVGLKLHPVSTIAAPGGEPTLALIRAAAELGVPTLFHCADDLYTTPWEIAVAAREVPSATIVLGHSGGYLHSADALEVARQCPNVVLETACTPYPAALQRAVDTIGPERVVFGSDSPGAAVGIELLKIDLLEVGDEARGLILGGNARRLFGEDR